MNSLGKIYIHICNIFSLQFEYLTERFIKKAKLATKKNTTIYLPDS